MKKFELVRWGLHCIKTSYPAYAGISRAKVIYNEHHEGPQITINQKALTQNPLIMPCLNPY